MDVSVYGLIFVLVIVVLIFFRKNLKRFWLGVLGVEIGFETWGRVSKGGRGGNASVGNGTALGGRGGASGPGGKGGDGGNAQAESGFAMGGEGGEAGQADRGGKGGRGPLHALMEDYPEHFKEIQETFGVTEEMAREIGRGGNGGDPTEKN